MSWPRPKLTDVALVSVLAILAHAEYQFGAEVLGLPEHQFGPLTLSLALAVPASIDSYVIAALRRGGRDVPWAIGLTTLSVAAGTVSHLVKLPIGWQVTAAAVFGAVMAVVLWRVHAVEGTAQAATDRLRDADDRALATARWGLQLEQDLAASRTEIENLGRELGEARKALSDLAAKGPAGGGPLPATDKRTSTVDPIPNTGPEAARHIAALLRKNPGWKPNYPTLMASTGRSKSFVEKAVSEARQIVAVENRPHLVAGGPR